MEQQDEPTEEKQETPSTSSSGDGTDGRDPVTDEQQDMADAGEPDVNYAAQGDVSSGAGSKPSKEGVALFEGPEREAFWQRWRGIQAGFVDEPQRSVEEANQLVADLMDRLVSSFRDEQSRLERQWSRGEAVTTEDLRVTLQRYRSFFGRLLEL